MNDHLKSVMHGVFGTIMPALGLITSMQEQLEYGLRITSLVIGIFVGILSLTKIIKKG
jgi:uncharacterized membrane protein